MVWCKSYYLEQDLWIIYMPSQGHNESISYEIYCVNVLMQIDAYIHLWMDWIIIGAGNGLLPLWHQAIT